MRVYRITAPAYVGRALSGEGAARFPGRWNSAGTRVAYTASSASLAILEMLVHVDRRAVPADRRLLTFEVPDDAIAALDKRPRGWDRLPYSAEVRRAGDAWVRGGASLALRVPSAVVRHEHNVLINPAHARFAEIRLLADEPLALDARMFECDD